MPESFSIPNCDVKWRCCFLSVHYTGQKCTLQPSCVFCSHMATL